MPAAPGSLSQNLRPVIYFVASSLDGYISGPGESLDWLFTDADYGITEFLAGVDTLLMGRRTYDSILAFGGAWPYPGKRTLVFSRQPPAEAPSAPDTTFARQPLAESIEALRSQSGSGIWLVGGGELAGAVLAAGMLDEVHAAVHPVILGGGIPLFPRGTPRAALTFVSQTHYPSGMLMLRYHLGGRRSQ